MDTNPFEQIASEVFQLMDQQMRALLDWGINGTPSNERSAYEARSQRILALRSELETLHKTR